MAAKDGTLATGSDCRSCRARQDPDVEQLGEQTFAADVLLVRRLYYDLSWKLWRIAAAFRHRKVPRSLQWIEQVVFYRIGASIQAAREK